MPPFAFSLSIHNCQLLYRYTHTPAAYSDVATNRTAISCTIGAHTPTVFIRTIFHAHLGASKLACREIKLCINLTYGPHVARGYLVKLQHKDIWNDVQQIIKYIIYEKLQLNTLVCGSLTLAPIITYCSMLVFSVWQFKTHISSSNDLLYCSALAKAMAPIEVSRLSLRL